MAGKTLDKIVEKDPKLKGIINLYNIIIKHEIRIQKLEKKLEGKTND